ncbi:response regulator [Chitiniphilus shinanonensis]|uniref:Response regulator n=1 Tax=Chitiniphilus shinanonensis TaxID=553088 RepID=A0ABQ6BUV7_9NEIS|nr:response regulator [Chitiniphilus shinanonensis]GLS05269.1 response regulator [Chitiniphilus shinanonensis]
MSALHILYVEDNAMLRATIAEYLADLGHVPVAVASAEDALAELQRQRFDVLLSDVSLPGLSGIELVRDAARQQPGLVLVLASGHDLSAEADLVGVPVQLLPKPFDIDALEAVLERASNR